MFFNIKGRVYPDIKAARVIRKNNSECAGIAAQLVESLPSIHKALGSVPSIKTGFVAHTIIPAWRRQEDQKFKGILGYTASLRLAWATEDAISKQISKKRSKKKREREKTKTKQTKSA